MPELHAGRRACNVSQPSLTRAIKGLEDELGGPLFHRERNHTLLTNLGRLMQPYLELVLQNMKMARGRAADFVHLKSALINIGIMCAIGPRKLVDFFRTFHARRPGIVKVPLIEPAFSRTVDLVTVRGRPHSAAVGAFVREAQRYKWNQTVPAAASAA